MLPMAVLIVTGDINLIRRCRNRRLNHGRHGGHGSQPQKTQRGAEEGQGCRRLPPRTLLGAKFGFGELEAGAFMGVGLGCSSIGSPASRRLRVWERKRMRDWKLIALIVHWIAGIPPAKGRIRVEWGLRLCGDLHDPPSLNAAGETPAIQ